MPDSSQSSQAYAQLRRDILTCRLEPGSRIAQAQLVERYAFGLTPIREALKRLEQEGFVRAIPRFGYRITPVTVKDVEDLYDLRQVLETGTLRLAIERASEAQVAEIERLAGFRYTFGDPDSYLTFSSATCSSTCRLPAGQQPAAGRADWQCAAPHDAHLQPGPRPARQRRRDAGRAPRPGRRHHPARLTRCPG
jgi:DNA-binding transcriptional MocR family regulator